KGRPGRSHHHDDLAGPTGEQEEVDLLAHQRARGIDQFVLGEAVFASVLCLDYADANILAELADLPVHRTPPVGFDSPALLTTGESAGRRAWPVFQAKHARAKLQSARNPP